MFYQPMYKPQLSSGNWYLSPNKNNNLTLNVHSFCFFSLRQCLSPFEMCFQRMNYILNARWLDKSQDTNHLLPIVVQWTPIEYRIQTNRKCFWHLCLKFQSVDTLIVFIGIHYKEQTTNSSQYDGFAKRVIHAIPGSAQQRTRVERCKNFYLIKYLLPITCRVHKCCVHFEVTFRVRYIAFCLFCLFAGNSNHCQRHWCVGSRGSTGVADNPCQHHRW